MPHEKVKKESLKVIALHEIRARRGCEDVTDVSIHDVTYERSKSNWSLAVAAFGNANRDTAQLAALVVQRDLQKRYQLITG